MFVLVVVQVIVFISGCLAKDLPSNIPKCHADDPRMGECIAKAANALRPYIRNGVKELGIPSFEPFHMSTYTISQSSNLVNYSGELWNYSISGLENYDLTEITYNPKTMTFKLNLQFDSVSLKAAYKLSGSLLDFPIEGTGTLQAALGPINGTFKMNGNMAKRKNVDHYNPKNLEIKLDVDDMSVHFDGLFDNNPGLGELTNNLVNQNSKVLIRAFAPAIETIAEKFIMRYFKWLTKTFSYYQLFPH